MTKAQVREKFVGEPYPIHVIGRHIHITDAMKNYAVDKLIAKMNRYHARVVDATIAMGIQRETHGVDYLLTVYNTRIKVSGRTENMYASVDQAIDKLEAKLTRYLERLHDHHNKGTSVNEMPVRIIPVPLEEINDLIEEATLVSVEEALAPGSVVSHETRPLKALTQEEAIMKIDLSGDRFMIYRSEEDKKLKVIYRRTGGNYGIIEPE